MTQPSINFADGSFPVPQKSEIQELTEAIRDLAAAIRGEGQGEDPFLAGVEERLARYNELRDREERTLGPEFGDSPVAIITDAAPEGSAIAGDLSDETWRADLEPVEVKTPITDAAPTNERRLDDPLADWEKDVLYSLNDLPDGAYVDLDPPRVLPRAVALKVDIDEDPEIMVHRVVKGEWVDDYGYTLGGWHAWSAGEDPEADTPWEFDVEQVEALKLAYSDFTLPTEPESESDPVKHPAHYQMGGRECIEVTRDLDFCWGNIVKYLWRAPHKGNPVQDIEKALEYLELAYWSSRPDGEPFDFFFDLRGETAAGSAEELQLDALAAIFNPYLSEGLLRGRIEDFRDHCLADGRV